MMDEIYGLLPDHMIREYVKITPFCNAIKRKGIISYGVSSYGYDVRLARKFKVFTNTFSCGVIDPKVVNEDLFHSVEGDFCIIPPNSYALGESLEYFEIPHDVLGICLGKSTYARCGVIANITPL